MACRVSAHPRAPGALGTLTSDACAAIMPKTPTPKRRGWVLLDAVQFSVQAFFIECLNYFAAFDYCEQLDAHFACERY